MGSPNYRLIARNAIPVKGNCYDCEKCWGGPQSRIEAAAHRAVTGHATWVECQPPKEEAE